VSHYEHQSHVYLTQINTYAVVEKNGIQRRIKTAIVDEKHVTGNKQWRNQARATISILEAHLVVKQTIRISQSEGIYGIGYANITATNLSREGNVAGEDGVRGMLNSKKA